MLVFTFITTALHLVLEFTFITTALRLVLVFTFIRNHSPSSVGVYIHHYHSPASVGVNMLMKSFTHTTDESFVRSPSGEVIHWVSAGKTRSRCRPTDLCQRQTWDRIERRTPTPVGKNTQPHCPHWHIPRISLSLLRTHTSTTSPRDSDTESRWAVSV